MRRNWTDTLRATVHTDVWHILAIQNAIDINGPISERYNSSHIMSESSLDRPLHSTSQHLDLLILNLRSPTGATAYGIRHSFERIIFFLWNSFVPFASNRTTVVVHNSRGDNFPVHVPHWFHTRQAHRQQDQFQGHHNSHVSCILVDYWTFMTETCHSGGESVDKIEPDLNICHLFTRRSVYKLRQRCDALPGVSKILRSLAYIFHTVSH